MFSVRGVFFTRWTSLKLLYHSLDPGVIAVFSTAHHFPEVYNVRFNIFFLRADTFQNTKSDRLVRLYYIYIDFVALNYITRVLNLDSGKRVRN